MTLHQILHKLHPLNTWIQIGHWKWLKQISVGKYDCLVLSSNKIGFTATSAQYEIKKWLINVKNPRQLLYKSQVEEVGPNEWLKLYGPNIGYNNSSFTNTEQGIKQAVEELVFTAPTYLGWNEDICTWNIDLHINKNSPDPVTEATHVILEKVNKYLATKGITDKVVVQ